MNKLKITMTGIALLLCFIHISGQSRTIIKNEDDLNVFFASEIGSYNDSLIRIVKRSGSMFLKFNIAKDSTLFNIACSEKQPAYLINIVQEILASIKIGIDGSQLSNNSTYVLPLYYNYAPEQKPVTTIEELRRQVPDIDVSNLSSYINLNFNNFFNVKASDSELWGIKCVVLPPLKISQPIVYH
jgi:hypothetical protein